MRGFSTFTSEFDARSCAAEYRRRGYRVCVTRFVRDDETLWRVTYAR